MFEMNTYHNNVLHCSTDSLGGGSTDTQKALQLAYDDYFSTANGARDGVERVLVLITDGDSTTDTDAISQAGFKLEPPCSTSWPYIRS